MADLQTQEGQKAEEVGYHEIFLCFPEWCGFGQSKVAKEREVELYVQNQNTWPHIKHRELEYYQEKFLLVLRRIGRAGKFILTLRSGPEVS